MQTHTPQSVDELHTILGEARQHHAHCVAPAWITPTAPLYDVLINVFDYPRPDGREFGIDGLAGRAWTTPIRGVNIDAPIYVFSSASDKTPEGAHELLQQCLSEIKHPTTVLVEHVPGRDANPRSWVR